MTIVGVAGCTALLVSAFGMYDGMNDLRDWEYEDINQYSSKLIVDNDASISQINSITDEVKGTQLMEGRIEFDVNDHRDSGSLLVLNKSSLVTPTDNHRNPTEIPDDGVSISMKMADNLGVEKGDTIKWHIVGNDKWVSTKVSSIHADPISPVSYTHLTLPTILRV